MNEEVTKSISRDEEGLEDHDRLRSKETMLVSHGLAIVIKNWISVRFA
jgi:hypothetical protein